MPAQRSWRAVRKLAISKARLCSVLIWGHSYWTRSRRVTRSKTRLDIMVIQLRFRSCDSPSPVESSTKGHTAYPLYSGLVEACSVLLNIYLFFNSLHTLTKQSTAVSWHAALLYVDVTGGWGIMTTIGETKSALGSNVILVVGLRKLKQIRVGGGGGVSQAKGVNVKRSDNYKIDDWFLTPSQLWRLYQASQTRNGERNGQGTLCISGLLYISLATALKMSLNI